VRKSRDAIAAGPEHLETGQVLLLSAGHLIHDAYPAFLAPLIPLLKLKLGISNALAGTLAAFLRSSSLVQPFIGYLADRTNARWFVVLAPGATAAFMSLLGVAPSYLLAIPLLMLAGLSHAAYHAPAPAMVARVSGGRVGTGMSVFMMGGELGRAAGPLAAVAAVEWFGLEGTYGAALPGLFTSIVMARLLPPIGRGAAAPGGAGFRSLLRERRGPLAALLAFVFTRALLVGSVTVFMPTVLIGRGMSLAQAGAGYALFELAGAAGALAGGTLSDRVGRRRTLAVTQLATVPCFLILALGPGGSVGVFLAVTGFVVFSATPVVLAIVQEMLPEARSTASGLFFSLNYLSTGLAAFLFGAGADALGVQQAFGLLAFTPLLSLPCIVFLPARSYFPRPASA
jgi:FSR family fosmidomycin resistance protein-like MFS transporter